MKTIHLFRTGTVLRLVVREDKKEIDGMILSHKDENAARTIMAERHGIPKYNKREARA